MNHIIDGLWVTDIESVSERPTSRFDMVVSVCQDACFDNVSCQYEQFPLADDMVSQKNWGGTTDYETFEKAADCVLSDFSEKEVLVHCHSGQNRSVAVCAAVIASYKDWEYEDAYSLIKMKRKIANPNKLMRSHAKRYIAKQ